MTLVAVPEPYDFELSTERFRVFGPDLANLWHEGGVHRVVGGREVRIEAAVGGVDVEPLDGEVEPVVRSVLGLPFELGPFYDFAASDSVLERLVGGLAGLRPPLAPDPFESLVTSVSAQQVSLFAAFAVRNRFIERFGERGVHAYAFPSRERVASASVEELRSLGFSTRKGEYVLGIARSDLELESLRELPDDEIRRLLTALPGIGEWTVDWFLARHLARSRAWPAGDLGLRKAVSAFYGVDGDVRGFGARFAPFENLSAHYLLTGLRVMLPA